MVSKNSFKWLLTLLLVTFLYLGNVLSVDAQGPACGQTRGECCTNPFPDCNEPGDSLVFYNKDGEPVSRASIWKVRCQCEPAGSVPGRVPLEYCWDSEKNISSPECMACTGSDGIYTALGCIPFNLQTIIQAFFLIALSFASFSAILCIIFAALKLQFGPGKGDANAVSNARSNIVSCLVGLIFMLFSVFIVNMFTGGILGFEFKADLLGIGGSSGTSTNPPPGPVPPISGAPNPSVSPVPPNPGKPSSSIITPEQVEEAVRFFDALKAADNGSCGTINQNNVANCLSLVNTGVQHEQGIKDRLPGEMTAINEFDLQCAGFAKAIYMIFTGEWMYGEFNGKAHVKNLKEPFWRFTYYPLGTTTPALGDYVKWTNDPYGHVAVIVNIIDDSKFEVLQANVNETRTQACPGCINRGPVSVTEAGLAGFYRLEK